MCLKLGFIGGGISSSIGRVHFVASQLDNHWNVVSGFFSRDQKINKDTSELWGIDKSRTYNSLEEFIVSESERIDAVVILTPAPRHKKDILRIMDAGIPIICEKPMTSSLDEALLIKEKAKGKNNLLSVTYNYSGYPMVRELRSLVEKGKLGKIHRIDLEMPQEGFIRINPTTGKLNKPKEWRLSDGDIPTICLDLGIHLHHLANFLTGEEPTHVMSKFSNSLVYENIVDDAMLWLKYDSGLTGSFWMSKVALGSRNGLKIRLYGTKASATWEQTDSENLLVCYKDGSRVSVDRSTKALSCGEYRYNRYTVGHPAGFIEAFANLYNDLYDVIRIKSLAHKHNSPYVYGINHSVAGMRLFSAAKQSNDQGCWVKV
jgi:predicted dehydrogenase